LAAATAMEAMAMAKNNNTHPKSFICPECGQRAEAYESVLVGISVDECLHSAILCTRCPWGDTFQGILAAGRAAGVVQAIELFSR
jgi:hypothetical protein